MMDLAKHFKFIQFKSEHKNNKDIMFLIRYIEVLETQIIELEQKLNELDNNIKLIGE